MLKPLLGGLKNCQYRNNLSSTESFTAENFSLRPKQRFCTDCCYLENGLEEGTNLHKLRVRSSLRATDIQGDTNKRELLKNPTKIEEIQEKKIIDRN